MPDINITVAHKVAVSDTQAIVCDNSDYTVHWTLDEDWSAYDTKTMRTIYMDGTFTDKVFSGAEVELPVCTVPGVVQIGLFAGDIRTSRVAILRALPSVRSASGAPADPTPDVYDQLMERMAQLESPDWAQNDPSAKDYVKNRTHYRSIDKATVTVKAGKEGILADMVPFEPGDVVGITVNGEEMSMTAASDTISVAGQSREFVYVGDSPSGVISGTVKYGWSVYTVIDMGFCAAMALKADCTIEYSAYVYTRLPMEYSPITLETDVRTESGAARNEYIKISNVIIDSSISYSDYPIAVTRTNDTGQAELVITGKRTSYRPVMKQVGINLICELLLNQNVFSWVMDPDKNLKKFFDENSNGLVEFSDVKIDGVLYRPFLQICSRGLYGTLAALTGSVYAVTVDFGSTVKAEWFDNKWKIVIKKIG